MGEWIVGPNRFVSDRDTPISFSPHHGDLFRQPLVLAVPNKSLSSRCQNRPGPASTSMPSATHLGPCHPLSFADCRHHPDRSQRVPNAQPCPLSSAPSTKRTCAEHLTIYAYLQSKTERVECFLSNSHSGRSEFESNASSPQSDADSVHGRSESSRSSPCSRIASRATL